MSTKIIPQEALAIKRLERFMGEDYQSKPALRLMLLKIEGLQLVESMDDGRSVEWRDLYAERERKIAFTYFWRGVEQAEIWQREGII